jgi:hypothetical protein
VGGGVGPPSDKSASRLSGTQPIISRSSLSRGNLPLTQHTPPSPQSQAGLPPSRQGALPAAPFRPILLRKTFAIPVRRHLLPRPRTIAADHIAVDLHHPPNDRFANRPAVRVEPPFTIAAPAEPAAPPGILASKPSANKPRAELTHAIGANRRHAKTLTRHRTSYSFYKRPLLSLA